MSRYDPDSARMPFGSAVLKFVVSPFSKLTVAKEEEGRLEGACDCQEAGSRPGARSLEQVELLWMWLWDFGKTWNFPEPLLSCCKTQVKTSGPFVVDAHSLIYQPERLQAECAGACVQSHAPQG